ncbi:unnamed protein product [Amoebophrya sp. A25]|nr:unnamed protein product [Amoebophrya sp. A25]|eukprot:GSA25T00015848001.1
MSDSEDDAALYGRTRVESAEAWAKKLAAHPAINSTVANLKKVSAVWRTIEVERFTEGITLDQMANEVTAEPAFEQVRSKKDTDKSLLSKGTRQVKLQLEGMGKIDHLLDFLCDCARTEKFSCDEMSDMAGTVRDALEYNSSLALTGRKKRARSCLVSIKTIDHAMRANILSSDEESSWHEACTGWVITLLAGVLSRFDNIDDTFAWINENADVVAPFFFSFDEGDNILEWLNETLGHHIRAPSGYYDRMTTGLNDCEQEIKDLLFGLRKPMKGQIAIHRQRYKETLAAKLLRKKVFQEQHDIPRHGFLAYPSKELAPGTKAEAEIAEANKKAEKEAMQREEEDQKSEFSVDANKSFNGADCAVDTDYENCTSTRGKDGKIHASLVLVMQRKLYEKKRTSTPEFVIKKEQASQENDNNNNNNNNSPVAPMDVDQEEKERLLQTPKANRASQGPSPNLEAFEEMSTKRRPVIDHDALFGGILDHTIWKDAVNQWIWTHTVDIRLEQVSLLMEETSDELQAQIDAEVDKVKARGAQRTKKVDKINEKVTNEWESQLEEQVLDDWKKKIDVRVEILHEEELSLIDPNKRASVMKMIEESEKVYLKKPRDTADAAAASLFNSNNNGGSKNTTRSASTSASAAIVAVNQAQDVSSENGSDKSEDDLPDLPDEVPEADALHYTHEDLRCMLSIVQSGCNAHYFFSTNMLAGLFSELQDLGRKISPELVEFSVHASEAIGHLDLAPLVTSAEFPKMPPFTDPTRHLMNMIFDRYRVKVTKHKGLELEFHTLLKKFLKFDFNWAFGEINRIIKKHLKGALNLSTINQVFDDLNFIEYFRCVSSMELDDVLALRPEKAHADDGSTKKQMQIADKQLTHAGERFQVFMLCAELYHTMITRFDDGIMTGLANGDDLAAAGLCQFGLLDFSTVDAACSKLLRMETLSQNQRRDITSMRKSAAKLKTLLFDLVCSEQVKALESEVNAGCANMAECQALKDRISTTLGANWSLNPAVRINLTKKVQLKPNLHHASANANAAEAPKMKKRRRY